MPSYTWPEAGLIYCEKEDTWCAYTDLTDGSCKAPRCDLYDPDRVAERERQWETMQSNHRREMDIAAKKIDEPKPYIRTQTKIKVEIIDEEIERKTRLMKYLYKYGKKHKAQKIEMEIDRLITEKNEETERR